MESTNNNNNNNNNESVVNEPKETQDLKQKIQKLDKHLKFDSNFDYYKHL